MLEGRNWFGFAGLPRARVPAVSSEEQFAEKLHACTLPRTGRENTRVKDLVDLVLLIERAKPDATRLAKSIRETFQRRNTHSVPSALAAPPASWSARFSEMAQECSIDADIHKNLAAVEQFYRELNL